MLENKTFEQLYKDYLSGAKNFQRAMSQSFDTFKTKYASPKKSSFNKKFFDMGNVYTFQYVSTAEPDSSRPFINSRPILLSFGAIENSGIVYETGIDLIAVPFQQRLEILARVCKFFKKPLLENVKAVENGRKPDTLIPLSYKAAALILNGTGWQMAYTAFDKSKVQRASVVDFTDWVTLVTMDTRSMRGAGLRTIYEAYIKRISNPPDPMGKK